MKIGILIIITSKTLRNIMEKLHKFWPRYLRIWRRSGQNCSLLSQKRIKNLVRIALYLARIEIQRSLVYLGHVYTTDFAASYHSVNLALLLFDCSTVPLRNLSFTCKFSMSCRPSGHDQLIWNSAPFERLLPKAIRSRQWLISEESRQTGSITSYFLSVCFQDSGLSGVTTMLEF